MINTYPLPDDDLPDEQDLASPASPSRVNPAADLIRSRIEQLYGDEPSLQVETADLVSTGQAAHSPHQRFMLELRASGRPEAEIQTDWHDYYASLSDKGKHEVWQEFYRTHAEASKALNRQSMVAPNQFKLAGFVQNKYIKRIAQKLPAVEPIVAAAKQVNPVKLATVSSVKQKIHTQLNPEQRLSRWQHIKSLLFGLGMGFVVLIVLLFGFFNERVIVPFVTPSRSVSNTPIINQDSTIVGMEPRVIVPKINLEVPVVYDEPSAAEKAIQKALEKGVVHYANTPNPGEQGNVVIVGHSSNNIFNKGRYKFAFVLLNRLEADDLVILNKNGVRYTYKVYEKRVVSPSQVEVLGNQNKPATLALITCDPPGTSRNRLVVFAEQVSPDPSANTAKDDSEQKISDSQKILPSNAPSLWSRIFDSF